MWIFQKVPVYVTLYSKLTVDQKRKKHLEIDEIQSKVKSILRKKHMNKNYIFVTKNEYARNVTYLGFETFELYQYLYCVTLQYLTRNKHTTFIYFLH